MDHHLFAAQWKESRARSASFFAARVLSTMALALCAAGANAASFSVLDQTLEFDLPSGYCLGGSGTKVERELFARTQRGLQGSAKLVAWLVDCKELGELKQERRQYLDHWLQIQVLTPGGALRNVHASREQVVASLAKTHETLATSAVMERVKRKYAEMGMVADQPNASIVGRDGNAAYLTMKLRLTLEDGAVRSLRGFGAISLINTVPLAVQGYEATGKQESIDRAQAAVNAVLRSLLVRN